jgi:hypothetical protein
MTLHTWELRSPAGLVDEVADRVPLTAGSTYLALVHHPSTRQRIVALEPLALPAVLPDSEPGMSSDVSQHLYDAMNGLGIPRRTGRTEHLAVTVVVRRGLCVFGPNEHRWLMGWRYSNHLTAAFDGTLFLVTEHGWAEFSSDTAGHSPALAA